MHRPKPQPTFFDDEAAQVIALIGDSDGGDPVVKERPVVASPAFRPRAPDARVRVEPAG